MNHHFCGCLRQVTVGWPLLWPLLVFVEVSEGDAVFSLPIHTPWVCQVLHPHRRTENNWGDTGQGNIARRQSSVPAAAARITDFQGCLLSGFYLCVMMTFSQACFQLVRIRHVFIATQTSSSLFLSYWRSGPFSSQQNVFPFCAVSKLSWVCCFGHYRFNLERR